MNSLKLHWASGKKNFGDWLSPALCEVLSGRPIIHAEPNRCDLIAVGSILGRVKQPWFGRRIHVWGTGYIEPQPVVSGKHFYHALRGHKTGALLRNVEVEAYGDPGLLCDLLLPDYGHVGKEYRLGLVPHYQDLEHPAVRQFIDRQPRTTLLHVFSETREFLRKLASCEFVISSSLHGLVAADAFGIPNVWAKLSDGVRGGDFKFHDYYSVFGLERPDQLVLDPNLKPAVIEELARTYRRPGLDEIKKRLVQSFPFPRPTEA